MNQKQIQQQFAAFQQSRILLTAFELDVFTLLDGRKETSAQLAAEMNCDARATDRLLNALVAMNYLEKKDGKFGNMNFVSEFLVKGKPEFMSGLYHTAHLWESWSDMTGVVRRGGQSSETGINERGERWIEAFIESMHRRAKGQAGLSAEVPDLSGVTRVLDVGGGSGAFSMAFADKKKGLTATVFDLPNVVKVSKKYIEKEGYTDRIDTFAGDYNTDDFPSGYDLIFLSAIVHINSYEENLALIKKCVLALNPGGLVVIQDFIMDEDRTGPAHGTVFTLNMLVGTATGDTYTEREIKEWMQAAGLTAFRRTDLPFGTGQIIGRKPE